VIDWTIIGGTGHRPKHLTPAQARWARPQSLRCLRHCRDTKGTTTVISGLALGWDTWIAEDALLLKLRLWAHIPFPQQAAKWKPHERMRWQQLVAAAAEVTTYGAHYSVAKLHERNDGMIAKSGLMFALWLPSKMTGGTASAIEKIGTVGKPWVHLDPAGQAIEPPGQCRHRIPGSETPSTHHLEQDTLPL
jgi:hypothetical protein